MSRHQIDCSVNGEAVSGEVEARTSLVDFLRDSLGLVGTHSGCDHGVCGACTVLVDGRSARACLTLAVQVQGSDIVTVEGLSGDGRPGELGALQEAFRDKQALQCGFCTPGMLIRAHEILRANPDPTREEIRRELASNLCRCTGYEFIIEAVLAAGPAYREGKR